MLEEMPQEVAQAYHTACRTYLAPITEPSEEPLLNRCAIKTFLPHRDPFLFVDQASVLDEAVGLIVAHYDLARSREILAGHFPECPVWPGVLQVEAIGQAGLIYALYAAGLTHSLSVAMTHILGARFMAPIRPNGHVQICARVFDNGLFTTVVGQCLFNQQICSAAAVSCF